MSKLELLKPPISLPLECYTWNEELKPRPLKPRGAVIHYISGKWTFNDDAFNVRRILIEILRKFKLSYHYLIDRKGNVYQLVPSEYQTKHAGYSRMNGLDFCNSFCFGIALISRGYHRKGEPAFEDVQITSLVDLSLELMEEHNFNRHWIKGHEDVREEYMKKYPEKVQAYEIDPKHDPGPLFPWKGYKVRLDRNPLTYG